MPELAAGEIVNKTYRVVRQLGEGGMGRVYLAEHIAGGLFDAIKVVSPEFAGDPDHLAYFMRDAKALHLIKNDSVVSYRSLLTDDDGRPSFLVMEYVEGPSLARRIRTDGAIPSLSVAELGARLAEGLHAAHEKGVIHRDISPDNIILREGRIDRPVIIDFGIARLGAPAIGEERSRIGGKERYMAPERAGMVDGDPNDPRVDVYSLGVVLAEAFYGQRMLSPSDMRKVDTPLTAYIRRMASVQPSERPAGMAEAAAALWRLAEADDLVEPVTQLIAIADAQRGPPNPQAGPAPQPKPNALQAPPAMEASAPEVEAPVDIFAEPTRATAPAQPGSNRKKMGRSASKASGVAAVKPNWRIAAISGGAIFAAAAGALYVFVSRSDRETSPTAERPVEERAAKPAGTGQGQAAEAPAPDTSDVAELSQQPAAETSADRRPVEFQEPVEAAEGEMPAPEIADFLRAFSEALDGKLNDDLRLRVNLSDDAIEVVNESAETRFAYVSILLAPATPDAAPEAISLPSIVREDFGIRSERSFLDGAPLAPGETFAISSARLRELAGHGRPVLAATAIATRTQDGLKDCKGIGLGAAPKHDFNLLQTHYAACAGTAAAAGAYWPREE